MVLNQKGQAIFYTLMLGVVVFVLALALIPVVKMTVDDSMNTTDNTHVGLDCSNSSIPDWQKSQCVLTDTATPYFFFGLIGIALLIIGARIILG